jgi:chorismate mutase
MDSQRRRIKSLDKLLIQLLKERVEVGKELVRIKKGRGFDVEDPSQEKVVIDRARSCAEDQISEECGENIEEIWKAIIELTKFEMRRYEKNISFD